LLLDVRQPDCQKDFYLVTYINGNIYCSYCVEGEIYISGNKNGALPALACALLTDEKVVPYFGRQDQKWPIFKSCI